MRPPSWYQLVAAILLLDGFVLPAAIVLAHGPKSQGTYVTTALVELKAGPGETYDTVRKFRKGTTFEIIGKEGDWLKIQLAEHANHFGYLHERFAVIKDLARHSDIKPRPAIPGAYVIAVPISIRRGPADHFAVVSKIPKGTKIVIIGIEGDWLRIASKRGEPPAYIERRAAFLEHVD